MTPDPRWVVGSLPTAPVNIPEEGRMEITAGGTFTQVITVFDRHGNSIPVEIVGGSTTLGGSSLSLDGRVFASAKATAANKANFAIVPRDCPRVFS